MVERGTGSRHLKPFVSLGHGGAACTVPGLVLPRVIPTEQGLLLGHRRGTPPAGVLVRPDTAGGDRDRAGAFVSPPGFVSIDEAPCGQTAPKPPWNSPFGLTAQLPPPPQPGPSARRSSISLQLYSGHKLPNQLIHFSPKAAARQGRLRLSAAGAGLTRRSLLSFCSTQRGKLCPGPAKLSPRFIEHHFVFCVPGLGGGQAGKWVPSARGKLQLCKVPWKESPWNNLISSVLSKS